MTDKKDNGGPAFPQMDPNSLHFNATGMTLRDYFAGQALAVIIKVCAQDKRKYGETIEEMFVRKAYSIADIMLEVRK